MQTIGQVVGISLTTLIRHQREKNAQSWMIGRDLIGSTREFFVVPAFRFRALTPLFGNGAGAFRIGKNSVVLTKIGKMFKVLCIEEFIVRLI